MRNDMMKLPKRISVSQAAELCGVSRTTVGYWVRSRKLFAQREGRSYSIPVEDLLHFLQSTGQTIPQELKNGNGYAPAFKSFQNCWHYWEGSNRRHDCENCAAFKRQIDDCFCVREDETERCPEPCSTCRYYQEVFVARFRFIHQIDFPAAVFKGLSFWGGNAGWAALCGIPQEGLIGIGIEKIIHPESLAVIISAFKRIGMADKAELIANRIHIITGQRYKLEVHTWVYPLREPEYTFLMMASPVDSAEDEQAARAAFI
jgi:excisionase family DNA binding protein